MSYGELWSPSAETGPTPCRPGPLTRRDQFLGSRRELSGEFSPGLPAFDNGVSASVQRQLPVFPANVDTASAWLHSGPMNANALQTMREALEKISAIHQPTSSPADNYDLEEVVEKLDFAVITARQALDRAALPDTTLN